MPALDRDSRKGLETTVKKARKIAETGARKIIDERLRVGDAKAPAGLSPAEQRLRVRLRAHGRQLGDQRAPQRETQTTRRLVAECAYEHWHRMLFARFLAETELLIEPTHGVPISLEECQELARGRGQDWLALASAFAVRMLPQIFRQDDPVLEVGLPPETRSALEDALKGLPRELFLADDSLGWVYQFWQADEKERVNKSETKIGADELPAVTQLFTEDYMVLFLLHNTLGAWWAGRKLTATDAENAGSEDELRRKLALPRVDWEYLRFVREEPAADGAAVHAEERAQDLSGQHSSASAVVKPKWRLAAGTFDGWPKTAREITVLDPCMGSGHFLVFALPILVAFRMAEEGLSREAAVDAVLRDNLHGLEIDPRCTQIAAFNLALAAWKMSGFHVLPELELACSGLTPAASEEEWVRLAQESGVPMPPLGRDPIINGLLHLHALFSEAATLGSLIDPNQLSADVVTADHETLAPYLTAALKTERVEEEVHEMAVAAAGMVKAADLLATDYTLVITNVPYLGRGRQGPTLKTCLETHFEGGRADLATAFALRCENLAAAGGTVALVTPQNWLFLASYKALREFLLVHDTWNLVARLGPRAFETIGGHVVNVALLVLTCSLPTEGALIGTIDVSDAKEPAQKAKHLRTEMSLASQSLQIRNPDARVCFSEISHLPLLEEHALSSQGIPTSDSPLFLRQFWEFGVVSNGWEFQQTTVLQPQLYGGRDGVILFENGTGRLRRMSEEQERDRRRDFQGANAWGHHGVAVSLMQELDCTLYTGEKFDNNVAAIVTVDAGLVPALWAFCTSSEFASQVRQIDQKLNVTNATLAKVPFDVDHWRSIAANQFPNGLPEPESDDPSQWLFHGRPESSTAPLQTAVARLVGYQWPAELDPTMRLSQRARELVGRCAELPSHVDADGVVCLTPVKGEASAEDRLLKLLRDSYRSDWSGGKLDSLLRDVGYAGKKLEDWLRDGFFENHCDVFRNRPFVWQIWDGQEMGFHALVNYHRLAGPDGEGRRTLEKLTYTCLGDWIDEQRRQQHKAVDGAEARLAAAVHLKAELEKILHGEPPYDIFVRWKPLHEQPIGWEPDINDGVRINIRPFMMARPLGARAKNACILRVTPKSIKWDADRGKEPRREKADFPWFWSWDGQAQDFAGGGTFDGKRWNGLHYTTAFKQAARQRKAAHKTTQSNPQGAAE